MAKMIVGLGNPGREYSNTKHNIGFMAVDRLAQNQQLVFNKTKHQALITDFFLNGEKIILVKPQTYMNLSGQAVKPLMKDMNVTPNDLVVIYDDMDLPIGKIRLRQKGSAGGHNGVKSLIQNLGTPEFNRIKVGIGRPLEFETVTQHVLSSFLGIYQQDVDASINQAIDAVKDWLNHHNFLNTMNKFN
ncbi:MULTISPECIES: aminoacyl-tRNA hydrolase [unclassified Granulicatella]|uniref:aminoacyl-tRNA hydrolase n=1 Tax=unclassified Granulicatella TaxID=2630493 RepID=UPI0010740AD1|nr:MULTISPECIES: aminoacyl-tRNA hydrolase [unclassified Granulicatella]MBF0780137.1 aminoacyl-tRNA hydrolase [Granulicatella sp. 19428wC4_WM01]TFU95742.1 aminoacyl-tRNA hydrolase [Granulicatella sp. WM01]